ncbi:MAG: efflux RND transporter permease subunit [Bacillota bacterium]|jgi:HAE1 family hydrophobic/amphiphilic exporter-1
MQIHELSIKHPVTVLMCVLIVLVLGGVSLSRLSIALMPDIDFPMAMVTTGYEGVGSEEMESMITKPVESVLSTVNNIKTITSASSEGYSRVMVEFNYGTDLDFAALKMREKLDAIRDNLPDDADSPTVMQMDPNTMPVVHLGITGKNNTLDDVGLKDLVEDKLEPRLERLDGVASVTVSGGKTREIRIEVDPQRAAHYGLTLKTISAKLRAENLNEPGGTVEYAQKNLLVRALGKFESLAQIEKIPLSIPAGGTVFLKDVATVTDSFKKVTTYARMNGANSIGVSVRKQSGGNTVQVVNQVKKELAKIQRDYPHLEIKVVFDQAQFIEKSINNVSNNAITGGLLAVIILILFLHNFRTALFIGTSIPISIIATFVLMYFTGITLNTVSLAGLALGVGMLVDNSIVVLENIHRHRQEGHSMWEAARLGAGEVGGAVLASTLTTMVVFLPIIFTEGITAQIFRELSLTVTFSLLASLVVSFTLIPMLCSKYLKVEDPRQRYWGGALGNWIIHGWINGLEKLLVLYRAVLQWALGHRKTTILTAGIIFIGSLCLIPLVGIEFSPDSDQGRFRVSIELPQGALLADTDSITRRVEAIIQQIPELEKFFVTVGGSGRMRSGSETNAASLNVTLRSVAERARKTAVIVDEVRRKVAAIAGAEIRVREITSSMGGGGGGNTRTPVEIKIRGADLTVLKQLAEQVKKIIATVDGVREPDTSVAEATPEARVLVDRDRAAEYGIGIAEVASLLTTAIQGTVATTYEVGGDDYNVRVEYPEAARQTYEQLCNIYVITSGGAQVPLQNIAKINLDEGPIEIDREDQERYVTVTTQIFGRDVGSITKDVRAELAQFNLPDGYTISYGGDAKNINEAFSNLTLALLLGVLLVYMIMASQFESLLQPFIIMFSVPLAYCGSIFALVLTGRALGMTSFIGVIMLAGIVVNNAIVLVDYVNTLKERGLASRAAILQAGPIRLKPILMTSLTTILGLLPLALGLGESGETMAPMATVVIGGLATSTILTLVIVPVIYSLLDDWHDRRARKKANRKAQRNLAAGKLETAPE